MPKTSTAPQNKTHYIKFGTRAWCGKIITPILLETKIFVDVTCLVCSDKYKFDTGDLLEWRLGAKR